MKPLETAAVVPALTDGAGPILQGFTGDFLYLAVVFAVLAILAAVVGARGVAGFSMEVARLFILLFIVLAIISLIL